MNITHDTGVLVIEIIDPQVTFGSIERAIKANRLPTDSATIIKGPSGRAYVTNGGADLWV